MTRFCTIASGSAGNCAVISDGNVNILIDAGVSAKRISEGLAKLGIEHLDGILITHYHTDHIAGLKVLLKKHNVPLFVPEGAVGEISRQAQGMIRSFAPGTGFEIGKIEIESFATPHDAIDSVGYVLRTKDGKIGFATDLGYVPQNVLRPLMGTDLVVLEANHDVDKLKTGKYSAYLKNRILSNRGHLSNAASADVAKVLVNSGVERIVLAHLSRENNTPELAFQTVAEELRNNDMHIDRDVKLEVAPMLEPGPIYIL